MTVASQPDAEPPQQRPARRARRAPMASTPCSAPSSVNRRDHAPARSCRAPPACRSRADAGRSRAPACRRWRASQRNRSSRYRTAESGRLRLDELTDVGEQQLGAAEGPRAAVNRRRIAGASPRSVASPGIAANRLQHVKRHPHLVLVHRWARSSASRRQRPRPGRRWCRRRPSTAASRPRPRARPVALAIRRADERGNAPRPDPAWQRRGGHVEQALGGIDALDDDRPQAPAGIHRARHDEHGGGRGGRRSGAGRLAARRRGHRGARWGPADCSSGCRDCPPPVLALDDAPATSGG